MPYIQFSTAIRQGDALTNVTVCTYVSLGCPATWEDPPTHDEAEIQSVTNVEGNELDLTDEQYDLLESEAIERVYEQMSAAHESEEF